MNPGKLKILLIDEGLNTGIPEASKIGGGQISRLRLFSQKDFFEVTVLTSEPEIANLWRNSARIVFNATMQCYRPPRSQIAFKLSEMRKLFRESIRSARVLTHELSSLKYDVIFLNDNKSRLLYIMSSIMRINRLPKAVTAIEMDTEWNITAYDWLIKLVYMIFFDKILCPSKATKMKLGLIGKLIKNKLQVAYPLVDSIGSMLENNRYKDGKKKLVFANIGTIWFKIKGQDIIVEAIEKLVKGRNDVPIEVRFYGDGPDLSELKRIIRERSLENYLKVLGREVDQNTIYADIQGCIIASRTETASMVLIECLQRNIPVIVSKLEPLLEIKKLFYNGFSFNLGDSNDLGELLIKAIDSNILLELHEILKKSDKEIFSLKKQITTIYEFFRDC